MKPMTKFEILNDGKVLRVYFSGNDEDRKELSGTFQENFLDTDMIFREITESYWTNGWGVHTADELGQMSECLVIAEDSTVEDDGSITLSGKVWTNIHNYQIASPIDQILWSHCDFLLWEDFKTPENFKVG